MSRILQRRDGGAVRGDNSFVQAVRGKGIPWKGVIEKLKSALPDVVEGREEIAVTNVRRALDEVFGKSGWRTEQQPSKSQPGQMVRWVKTKS